MALEPVNSCARSNKPRSPFYIPMTAGDAARRSLKHDDTFIVLDSHGDIGGPDGLFTDTRYLARLEMMLDDVQPPLLGSTATTIRR
jgi:hypothetical protein